MGELPGASHDLAAAGSPGATQIVPPVPPPKVPWYWWLGRRAQDERNQIEKDGSQSHNIRRLAGYGALLASVCLYAAGLFAIVLFLGFVPGHPRIEANMWHVVVAVLVALFTVPTVLIIVVLRVTSASHTTEIPQTVHEALGKMVEKLFDKVTKD